MAEFPVEIAVAFLLTTFSIFFRFLASFLGLLTDDID